MDRTPVIDDEGRFVWNKLEYNGHIYSPYELGFGARMDSYRKSFPVYDDDIYLPNYPKSGTHFTWEILMMLIHGSAEYRQEHKVELMLEVGLDLTVPRGKSRRIINTHMRHDDMPPDILNNSRGKIIQVHRNPADVAVSWYHHLRKEAQGAALAYDWDDYITKLCCDRNKMLQGTWFDYTCEWWTHCNKNPNYLAVFYEELKEDPVKSITKIAEFIEVKADQDLIQSIADQTSFQKMKEAKRDQEKADIELFFDSDFSMYRKGVVGDWRNHFTKEQHQQFMEHFNLELQDFPEFQEKFVEYLKW